MDLFTEIIKYLSSIITSNIDSFGNLAVFVFMTLESANLPIPSEVILPYAGFVAAKGALNFHIVALVGALGCTVGSIISYYLGLSLGRPLVLKYGKWFFIPPHELERMENFIHRFGDATFFVSRLLPVVRTFISIVVGTVRGKFIKFVIYCFFGSWIWSYALTYLGFKMGQNWELLEPWWHKFSLVILSIILLGIFWHIARAFIKKRVS